ncbi:MAG: uracil phosphoribosyltransferase [Bacteroidetes bacterium]|nr:uracil phosphoribosyltransferase [Bacteroidota bacterium]
MYSDDAGEECGRILYISSVVAHRPLAGTSAYAASKAALEGLTRAQAVELSRFGITVNCIAPGYFDAGMISSVEDDIRKDLQKQTPAGRLGHASELAAAVVYLCATPLGIANISLPSEQPVVGTILRAGLPLHQGVLNYFDHADNAFISAYRKHHKDGSFDIRLEYVSSPSLEGRILILADPMLATGASLVTTFKAILEYGKPRHTHIVAALASSQGIEFIKKNMPEEVDLWIGAIDEELTAQAYIVPGLGDAGDLAYGEKQ